MIDSKRLARVTPYVRGPIVTCSRASNPGSRPTAGAAGGGLLGVLIAEIWRRRRLKKQAAVQDISGRFPKFVILALTESELQVFRDRRDPGPALGVFPRQYVRAGQQGRLNCPVMIATPDGTNVKFNAIKKRGGTELVAALMQPVS